MALPHEALGLSAVCDCGISRSYSLTIFDCILDAMWLLVVCISSSWCIGSGHTCLHFLDKSLKLSIYEFWKTSSDK